MERENKNELGVHGPAFKECACLQRIETLLTNEQHKTSGKRVENAEFMDVGYAMDGSTIHYSRVQYNLIGEKRKRVHTMYHLFCPFCGKPVRSTKK